MLIYTKDGYIELKINDFLTDAEYYQKIIILKKNLLV